MNERGPDAPIDDRLEWDRDGQYYHYLTKWMHALNQASSTTKNPDYGRWAIELAKTAYAKFTCGPSSNQKRMYWKMSIGISRVLLSHQWDSTTLSMDSLPVELQVSQAEDRKDL